MKPPFAYFGGKMGMASDIVALMPEHRVYVEPFFGSGAVLLAKPPARHEIVNDIDRALVTFWKVLRERPQDLEAVCALTPYARDEYVDADLTDLTDVDELEVARRWWVRVNQSFAQTAGKSTGWSLTVATRESKPNAVLNRIERFAPVAERMSGVSIENCDAAGLIDRMATAPDAVVYVDPPYLSSSRVTRSGNGGDYRHDMGTIEAHERLAVSLHASPAHVIISGYPSPLYDRLYGDWHIVDRHVTAKSSNRRRGARTGHERVERLWLNYEPSRDRLFA